MDTLIQARQKTTDARKDAELVTSAQSGDVSAFERLVNRYHGLVYALSYARLQDREAAEDLLQEVFLRVFLNIKDLHQPQYYSAWLTRVTRNLAMDWVRRGQRRSFLTPMVSLEANAQEAQMVTGSDLRDEVQSQQESEMLEAALQKLPFEQREMVLLYFAEDQTHEEIARK